MKYNIPLVSKAAYELDSSLYTPEQFPERKSDIEFQILAPCEVNGQCPYDDCNCSLCR